MKPDVKVVKYRQLPHIKSNDVNNSLLDFMNQEAEIGDCHSYENEVHNEERFTQDNNMDAFTGQVMKWTSPPVQVNERSKIVENNASIIPHEYYFDNRKFDHMQRKFERDKAVSIHADMLLNF